MTKLAILPCAALAFSSACSTTPPHRVEFSSGFPVYDCPESLEGAVQLFAEARPANAELPAVRATSIVTTGAIGRRVLISMTPAGLRPEDRVIWSSLSLSTFGGTFAGWTQAQTDFITVRPADDAQLATNTRSARAELLGVVSVPGQVKVTRSAQGNTNLLGTTRLDLLVLPGGMVVDDTVLRVRELWTSQGSPVPPEKVIVELTPMRHPPGYDTVVANVQLDYIVRQGSTRDEWSCSAETRVTLVDRDAVRAPYWDIGPAWSNAGRREWLALFEPSTGAVRAMFDSPASANALMSWVQATRATAIGAYTLGLFQQSVLDAGRPFGLLGPDVMGSFRPLSAEDFQALRVGPVGEP